MFDLHYLNYLYKSKKYLLIFEILVTIMIGFDGDHISKSLLLSVALGLCYIIPVNVFSFVQDKKAIDSYFSLPIERKKMLATGLLFSAISIYAPFASGIVINALTSDFYFLDLTIGLALMLLGVITLVIFNTFLYFLANNKIDGIITIGAYNFLPYAFLIVVLCFYDAFVCGNFVVDYDSLLLISPIYNVIVLFINNVLYFNDALLAINDFRYIAALIIELVGFTYLLFYSFNKRQVEIAESASKRFFAYPLIIGLYCSLCMFGISSSYSYYYDNYFEFFSDNVLLYIILFVIFVVAHFIYQRKFYFNFKMIVYYLTVFALSIAFCFVARASHGFGLSMNYPKDDPSVRYTLDISVNNDYEEYKSESITSWFKEQTGKDVSYMEISIEAISSKDNPLNVSTAAYFEKERLSAINDYYDSSKHDRWNQYAHLNVYNDYQNNDYQKDFYYQIYETIEIADLLELVKDSNVYIQIYADSTDYHLNEDGKLLKIEYGEYEIEEID